VVLDASGLILAEGQPASVFRAHREELEELGVWLPLAVQLDGELDRAGLAKEVPPLTLEAALDGIDAKRAGPVVHDFVARHVAPNNRASRGDMVARLTAADCAPLYGPTVLRDVSLTVHASEILGILGANGAGKSTLGASLAGLLRLKRGSREGGPGGIAFQNPENQFIAGSVSDEIAAALPRGFEPSQVNQILIDFDLAPLRDQHPFELSQGQKRRLSLAALTASGQWPLFVLDEPTAGLDARGVAMVVRLIERLAQQGHAIVIITHDMDLSLRLCPRSVIVAEGRIIADGPTVDHLNDPDLLARAGLAEPAIAPALRWLRQHASC
jgi:energy-coupling factor transporter ATP-binding protein EcfA2